MNMTPTTRDAEGPYWVPDAPVRAGSIASLDLPGLPLLVEGRVMDACGQPLAGAILDVWQADARGRYHGAGEDGHRLRGRVRTDARGRYRFETIMPGRYSDDDGIRPAHLHVSFLAPDGRLLLTSQLYFEGDPYLGEADYATRVGSCNSADRTRHLRLVDGFVGSRFGKRTVFDAVVAREERPQK